MRPYTTDTQSDAVEVQTSLVRGMHPHDRLKKAVRMTTRIADECKQAIRRNNPTYSEQQVGISFIELNYGEALAREVENYLRKVNSAL